MMPAKPIAIVEVGNSHDECLYSQVLFLKEAGYSVHLLLSDGLKKQEDNFPGASSTAYFLLPQKGLKGWKELINMKRYLKQHGITKVIFNTASGKIIRNFILLNIFNRRTTFAGTIHHTGKLIKSSTQKFISLKVKKYFVLNDYLMKSIHQNKNIQIASYYPVFFPEFRPMELVKPHGELWICIPGQLEIKRRDYLSLISQLNRKNLPEGIRFIFLGRSNHKSGNGEEIKALIKKMQLEKHFVLFDHFIENTQFHTYLNHSDIILPLIHQGSEGFESYSRFQITGAFNLAFAYNKPLLMHKSFSEIPDFLMTAFFYDLPGLAELCVQLYNQPSLYINKNKEIAEIDKFKFAFQQKQYLSLLTKQ